MNPSKITLRLDRYSQRCKVFIKAINQGIDARLEAATHSEFKNCGFILEAQIDERDLPVIYRRLAELHDPEADKLIATIERLKAIDYDAFTKAYLLAALWSSGDIEAGCEQFETKYTIADIHPDSLAKAADDCARFRQDNDLTEYPIDRAGHDFWMTRNHHGVGFWEDDYGTEEQCKKLTESSHKFGEVDLYIGDDGMLHFSR